MNKKTSLVLASLTAALVAVGCATGPSVAELNALTDQIVKAIRDKGGVAWHLLGKNEGHGFAKKENVDYQFWSTLMFWKQNYCKTSIKMS